MSKLVLVGNDNRAAGMVQSTSVWFHEETEWHVEEVSDDWNSEGYDLADYIWENGQFVYSPQVYEQESTDDGGTVVMSKDELDDYIAKKIQEALGGQQ